MIKVISENEQAQDMWYILCKAQFQSLDPDIVYRFIGYIKAIDPEAKVTAK